MGGGVAVWGAPHGRVLGRARPATRGRREASIGSTAAGAAGVPKTGEVGSPIGGAPATVPCGLNPFD
jgi:hypothetical protein